METKKHTFTLQWPRYQVWHSTTGCMSPGGLGLHVENTTMPCRNPGDVVSEVRLTTVEAEDYLQNLKVPH